MNWVSALVLAFKGFWAGLTAARKAKAQSEIERGEAEVKRARDNAARVEVELE